MAGIARLSRVWQHTAFHWQSDGEIMKRMAARSLASANYGMHSAAVRH
jgi:hypothetical protein